VVAYIICIEQPRHIMSHADKSAAESVKAAITAAGGKIVK
jgi:hypothetical protein